MESKWFKWYTAVHKSVQKKIKILEFKLKYNNGMNWRKLPHGIWANKYSYKSYNIVL